MDLTVIIPTRGRAAKLAACIAALSEQTLGVDRFEVLIGIDGEESGEARAVGDAAHGHLRSVIREFPRVGLAAVRNSLLEHARGRILLSMNDDVLAERGMLEAHVTAHARAAEAGKIVTVVGDSPWLLQAKPGTSAHAQPERLWDRLVRDTSLFFFYDQMPGAHDAAPGGAFEPGRDWGFRHAFGLNVSYPTYAVREVGGYAVLPVKYGYEDVEIAWRLRERFGAPVLFEPAARGWHEHRYEPRDYLEREYKLGYAAWGFAQACPACARELFGREVRSSDEVEYSRQFVANERKAAERARAWFEKLEHLPADAIGGPHSRTIVQLVYQQHLPLKRWLWRQGLIDAAHGEEMRTPDLSPRGAAS